MRIVLVGGIGDDRAQGQTDGQVNLVLVGRGLVDDGASFTLTSGVVSHDPIHFGSSVYIFDGAINGFVRAAAIDLPRGLGINAVSPGALQESMGAYGPYFRGHEPVPAARVALAHTKSAGGRARGRCSRCSDSDGACISDARYIGRSCRGNGSWMR